MLIYKVTNLVNNKKYFCVTGGHTLKYAIWSHRHRAKAVLRKMKLKPESRMGKSPFHKALARYGENNFKYSVCYNFSNKTDAYACKELLIDKYNTMNPEYGYNCTTGGNKSFNHAPHVKERLSVAHAGKIMPESWTVFMRDEVKNHPEKHPHFQKGYIKTEEDREKMRQGQLNSDYVPSEETNKKTSDTMKKRWQEPEIIAKMAKRKRGVVTESTRRKLSRANSGKNNAMYGKPAWNRGISMTEEQKKKIQEGREKYQTKRRKKLLEKYKNRTEKKCRKCKDVKPLDMFSSSKINLDGYIGTCKPCEKNRGRERYYRLRSPNKVRNRYGKLVKDVIKG